ncbi:post-GPI attachment to proteins factor 6 [Plodia interpunctella]|uniref:post-GPI attachment to proteins factor 6 n=1 Tax=Plodia interpunctella TaxID=58824 RepID=UPI002367DD7C|nr:post-GPI attachment to proteins factor 6 [Plodia interpunctella]
MKLRLCFLLFYVYSAASNGDSENKEETNRKKIIDQLMRARTVLLDDYELVKRQVATDVYMYKNYRSVSVIFYKIMSDVSDAQFTFEAEELHLNNIGSCDPQEVIVNIKYGSYPAVNPDGYDFPKGFVDPGLRESIHSFEFHSDGKNKTYAIENPKPGNWYALVYIKWKDPRTQKVEQQDLVPDCQTILYTDLQVKRDPDIQLIDCYEGLTIDYGQIPEIYKCMAINSVDPIVLNLTAPPVYSTDFNITFKVQALSLPSDDSFIIHCYFDPNVSVEQTITFYPYANEWHYIEINHTHDVNNIANCESYLRTSEEDDVENDTVLLLMRDDRGRFFTFDYGLPTTDLHDATSLVNITSNEIKVLKFRVNDILDIGGSLAIEASLLMSLKYYMGYKREHNDKSSLIAFTEDSQYFKAVICMDIGHSSIPLEDGRCRFNDQVRPALFILNSTDSESIHRKIIIPFPESGTWYLSIRLFCDETVCPCPTSDNGTKYYVNATASDGRIIPVNTTTENWREGTSECNSTVVLSISSSSCIDGRCSNHGTCLFNTFGGLVMSYCGCIAGYGAWDCSDDSRMDSKLHMLVTVLFLTLSNLVLFFSIYSAVIRLYYTEAMIYAFTMVFSTFYHACDAPIHVAYCILNGNVLQFGDFYCGIMSFWVTLLAMSIIGDKFRSSLQLIGALIIALLTTWNRHSFMAFLIPVAVGVVLLIASWYWDFRKLRKWKFPRSYYKIYLPLGLILVSIGLISFAFLQTEQNYRVVHSFWHMIIAVSVAFLLPDIKRGEGHNPFVPSPNYCKLPSCRFFRRPAPPIAQD